MSCGCQKRTTADGRSGCTKCVGSMQKIKPTSTSAPSSLESNKK